MESQRLRFLRLYDIEFQLQTVSDDVLAANLKKFNFRGVMEQAVKMHSHQVRVCGGGCAATVQRWGVMWFVVEKLMQTVTTKTLSNSQLQAPGRYVALLRVAALPRQDTIEMELEMLHFIFHQRTIDVLEDCLLSAEACCPQF